jgi:hypothetical protein
LSRPILKTDLGQREATDYLPLRGCLFQNTWAVVSSACDGRAGLGYWHM